MAAESTGMLAAFRQELVDLVAPTGIPLHAEEPKSVGQAPMAYLGRPSIAFVDFDRVVEVRWPLTVVGHGVDTNASQHELDDLVGDVWGALGYGSQRLFGDQARSLQVLDATPTTRELGDVTFPTYEFTVRFAIPISLCSP
jgi:hypothetical protein